jgi:hypothetical protein
MALTEPWPGEDDDTGYDYHDTPSGNIWRPGAEPRAATRRQTRAAAGERPAGRRFSSLP